jgi:hypothetical protein
MARIKLENVEVTQLFNGKGFVVAENVNTQAGTTFQVKYTIWDAAQPAEGDLVNITGEFTCKLRDYPSPSGLKYTIDRNINKAIVEKIGTATVSPAPEAALNPLDTELPF